MTISPDGRQIALMASRTLTIVAEGEDREIALPAEVAGELLALWSAKGLVFFGVDHIDVVDPVSGTITKRKIPQDATAVSPDLEYALVERNTVWQLESLRSGNRSAITSEAPRLCGPVGWAPDGRRIAAVALSYSGDEVHAWLRIIDTRTLEAKDSPIRLDHAIEGGLNVGWIDSHRVVINGSSEADAGESLWIAGLDATGRVDEWEQRLVAQPGQGYGMFAVANGTLLVHSDTLYARIVRVRRGVEKTLSDVAAIAAGGGLGISADRRSLVVATSGGPTLVDVEDGKLTRRAGDSVDRITSGPEGSLLVIEDGQLVAIHEDGARELLATMPAEPGLQPRCSVSGEHCVIVARTQADSTLRMLGRSGLENAVVLPYSYTDVAVSPDGRRMAITSDAAMLEVMDMASGDRHPWPLRRPCDERSFPQLVRVAWSEDGTLYASVRCNSPLRSRIFRLIPGDEPEMVLDAADADIASIAVSGDDVYAIVRSYATLPLLVEGM